MGDAIPALKLYFAAFIFMLFQYIGQTTFKSLNKKKQAIFFSILRKVVIVVPLTYLLPYTMDFGPNGVFMAEPISNVIGGSLLLYHHAGYGNPGAEADEAGRGKYCTCKIDTIHLPP